MSNKEDVEELQYSGLEIAVIGMAGRFPGANSLATFWENIAGGVDSIAQFTDEELLENGIDPSVLHRQNYVKAKGFIEDVEYFDAAFFSYSEREAEMMDPQIRVLQECAWEALESAGYIPSRYEGNIGLFAGASTNFRWMELTPLGKGAQGAAFAEAGTLAYKDALSTLTSYKLGLKGPSLTLYTACSTSLLGIHLASRALITGECNLALAGGVSINYPKKQGYLYEAGMTSSPDGHVRPFDANAAGAVFSDGAGIVLLKRLDEALQDGDHIYAVIKGSAVNNDGARKVGYTAPSIEGQAEVIMGAQRMAEVKPETISYIETHGTATALGDTIEFEALRRAFATTKKSYCAIGSVKSNIGHLNTASGIAGFIKTVLALQHRQIPPSLHFEHPNPKIDFVDSPFYLNTELSSWNASAPLRAGVSSFGYGGTNVHLVLEEAPLRQRSPTKRIYQMITLSAKTPFALEKSKQNLIHYLHTNTNAPLADIAYTLHVGRKEFPYRLAVLCTNGTDALTNWATPLFSSASTEFVSKEKERDVLLCLGAGEASVKCVSALYELYQSEQIVRNDTDDCLRLISAIIGTPITSILENASSLSDLWSDTPDPLMQFYVNFTLEYALARAFIALGIVPAAILASGLSHYVAACLANVFTVEDALHWGTASIRLLSEPGYMVSQERFSHVVHSTHLNKPDLPIISASSGLAITDHEAQDPAFWLQLVHKQKHFVPWNAHTELQNAVILQIGESNEEQDHWLQASSLVLLQQFAPAREVLAPGAGFLDLLSRLWMMGKAINWQKLYAGENRSRLPLPTYPFEKKRFWIDSPGSIPHKQNQQIVKHSDIANWFYQPVWQVKPTEETLVLPPATWLVFQDHEQVGVELAARLSTQGHRVVVVHYDNAYKKLGVNEFVINATQWQDYHRLLEDLSRDEQGLLRIVHLWTIGRDQVSGEDYLNRGFYSLINLAKAIAQQGFGWQFEVNVLTNQLYKIIQTDQVVPEKAMLLAPLKVMPQEHFHVRCRCIDFGLVESGEKQALDTLLQEITLKITDTEVAYRRKQRYIRTFEAISADRLQAALAVSVDQAMPVLRARGVYIITGGLGSIGLRLAQYLARAVQARLILISRGGLPPREEWPALIERDEQNLTRFRMCQVRELEASGAQVLVLAADVANEEQMDHALSQAEAIFGHVDGIIHAAGILHVRSAECPLENIEQDDCEEQFRPKMGGLKVLHQLFQHRQLDFRLLVSSLSPLLGGLGFVAYAGANLYMDAFVSQQQHDETQRWMSINWGDWQYTGPHFQRRIARTAIDALEMTTEEAIKTFQCILALDNIDQVVISSGDLFARIAQWIELQSLQQNNEQAPADTHFERSGAQRKALLLQANDPEQLEQIIVDVWLAFYRVQSVDHATNFFELGATSLDIIQIHTKLVNILQRHIPIEVIFEHPTITELAAALSSEEKPEEIALPPQGQVAYSTCSSNIAVIGLAGRFPGAASVAEFWNNLVNGVESIRFFSDEELENAGIRQEELRNPNYRKAKGYLEGIEYFDASFFDYTPRDASLMDPQLRIFHECAWSALEHAGYNVRDYSGKIGVFAGASSSLYWQALSILAEDEEPAGLFLTSLLANKDSLSTQISYKFNLNGPCVNIFSGCSTSMVAIDAACNSLLMGQCDMAMAGGITVALPEKTGYLYQEGMLFSADGHCRAFDANASGMVFGDGVGVVILKPLEQAIADGDTIHAVVKGTAINNDGHRKIGYTAPSVDGQAEVIRAALSRAGVEPESIGYIETHGTGTQLGDVIEIAALKKVFGGNDQQTCPLGSVKTNVGHLNAASGVAGFIKAVLCIEKKIIPPNLHFETPNPQIDFKNSHFYVNTIVQEWKADRYPLRAGVSSFGIGGTNAHAILEEAPQLGPSDEGREWKILCISAKSEAALERMTDNLAEHLKLYPTGNLADVAYTLQLGRQAFEYRRTLVCRTPQEAQRIFLARDIQLRTSQALNQKHPVVFMFPGNGSQYVNMARELYEQEEIFHAEIHRCFAILANRASIDVRSILYPERGNDGSRAREEMLKTPYSQPIIFCVEYALAKLLIHWGIQPSALIGYSFGEYVAACLAGVFSLDDALPLVAMRGRLMGTLPVGAMLSVPLLEEQTIQLIDELKARNSASISSQVHDLIIAIDNGPSCIVSGSPAEIADFERFLRTKHILSMRISSDVAAHSSHMEEIADQFSIQLKKVALHRPTIPFISGITGTWITDEQAQDPDYWLRHMKETIRFADGAMELAQNDSRCFIEVGPGRDLSVLLQRFVEKPTQCIQHTIRPAIQDGSDIQFIYERLGALWAYGITIDWSALYGREQRRRIPLPTYAFEHISYKREGNPFELRLNVASQMKQKEEIQKRTDLSQWFYVPRWRSDTLPITTLYPERHVWLVFADRYGIAAALAQELRNARHTVITVEPCDSFARVDEYTYRVNLGEKLHYQTLIAELQTRHLVPNKILHCASLSKASQQENDIDAQLGEGFYSFLFLLKALTGQSKVDTLDIRVVTTGTQSIIGDECLVPAHACIAGPGIVITQELPYVKCMVIDIVVPETRNLLAKKLHKQLLAECLAESEESMVAYRGEYRWIRDYQPFMLERPTPDALPLRHKGVYLITGGFGGIGKILARHLAQKYQAKIVLISRSPLPARSDWQEWLSSQHGREDLVAKIRFVQELEKSGAEVLIADGDVADKEMMAMAIDETEQRFGALNGVIHAAGLLGDETFKVIRELEVSDCEKQFRAKIHGVLVLEELLRTKQLDFCLLMSSIASVLGGLSYGAYTAANQFMDTFVHQQARYTLTPWYTVNWSDWKHWDDSAIQNALGQSVNKLSMLPEEGIDAFERVLACEEKQLIHSPGDLDLRIAQWVKLQFVHEYENSPEQGQRQPRPALSTPYVKPRNEVEKMLTALWASVFKVEQTGIHDDFFEMGGDSLKGVIAVARIHKELGVEVPVSQLFLTPTIAGLAGFIQNAQSGEFYAIPVAVDKEFYPLPSAQKRLYILHQLHPDSTAYNDVMAYVLDGELDAARFEAIFKQLIERHESLRTSFELQNGEPVQKIHSSIEFSLFYQETTEEIARDLVKHFIAPFDLAQAPLMRVGLLKISMMRHILLLDIHHIITDGVSYDCLVRDFIALYQGNTLLPLKLQYKDYAEWQHSEQARTLIAKHEAYWLKTFAGSLPTLNLITDYPRPAVQNFLGNSLKFELGKELTERLKKAALTHNSTIYMHLLSVFNILLFKYTGQNDIIVGSPVAGRSHPDLQGIIGMFVNMLPLRTFLDENKRFIDYLHEVQNISLKAFENDMYQYDELVVKLGLHGNITRNPLFNVVFVLQNMSTEQLSVGDLQIAAYDFTLNRAQFDLLFSAVEIEEKFVMTIEYATALFHRESITKMADRYLAILEEVLDHPEIILSNIPIAHTLHSQGRDVHTITEEDFAF